MVRIGSGDKGGNGTWGCGVRERNWNRIIAAVVAMVLRNGAGREGTHTHTHTHTHIYIYMDERRRKRDRDFEAGGWVRRVVARRVTRLMLDVAERRLPRLGCWTVLRTSS